MPSLRLQRVRELLKRELGEILRREISIAEAGVVTVTDVEVASDLHFARVFVGIIGTPEQQKAGITRLQHSRKHIQYLLGQSVVLKYTPHLRFVIDDSVERGNRVLSIIEEIEKDLPPS